MSGFGFDAGSSGSSGPWLVWSAKGTEDGSVDPRSFYIREGSGQTASKTPTDGPAKGMLLDIHSLKTGWQQSGGGVGMAPKWMWGASPSQLPAKPGDDWKKGFFMKIALPGGSVVTWEQAGAGAWEAFARVVPAINAGPYTDAAQLPLVKFTRCEALKFTVGGTTVPILELVKWMPRPPSLMTAGNGFVDTGDNQKAKAPEPEPQMEVDAEDLSF
tara:strand:- start:38372 stop:39016 length:645 start_codon:yes stop_codon:yes gene_type:complete